MSMDSTDSITALQTYALSGIHNNINNIRPANRAGPVWQPRSLHGARSEEITTDAEPNQQTTTNELRMRQSLQYKVLKHWIRVLQCCISQAMRSASVKKLFYYYRVYTGCCVSFNTVFSKLKCDLVAFNFV